LSVVNRIPLSRPSVGAREEALVLEALRSSQLSFGPMIDRFEQLVAERVGAPFAAAVSSGTAGLHLATHLAQVGPGDEVITSPYSFVASANCAIYEGATPVFADVDPGSLNLRPDAVEAAITERTRAVVAVDIFGYPAELDELRQICDRHGLALIEDACQAIGARYKGRPLGSQGNTAVFAFYPNKQMTTGEGGVLTTHDEEEWRALKSLANQGRGDTGSWLLHVRLGWNYRMDELSAAVGVAQLERLDELLAQRASVAERYDDLLADIDGVELLAPDDEDHERSWFVYVVKLATGVDRDEVIERLDGDGVVSRPYLPCIHLQPYMRERYGFAEGMCPVAEDAGRRTLALPFFPDLEQGDQERVAEALAGALRK
jgi:perosamine synthetase